MKVKDIIIAEDPNEIELSNMPDREFTIMTIKVLPGPTRLCCYPQQTEVQNQTREFFKEELKHFLLKLFQKL